MVTHDPSAAAWADRVVFMADGRLAGELLAPTAEEVAERLTGAGGLTDAAHLLQTLRARRAHARRRVRRASGWPSRSPTPPAC